MEPVEAVKTGFNKLQDMSGTAGRAEYWWYMLAVFVVGILAYGVLVQILGVLGSFAAALVFSALGISATIRRLREAGYPETYAYGYFGLYLLTAISVFIMPAIAGLLGLVTLVAFVAMIYFLVQPPKTAS